MNINYSQIVNNISQANNIGKTIQETFDKTEPETINALIENFATELFSKKENILKNQPEKKEDLENLEKNWKIINLKSDSKITSEFQKEISQFNQQAQKIFNLQENKNMDLEKTEIKASKEEEKDDTPAIDNLPAFITFRAKMGFPLEIDTNDPFRLFQWADSLKTMHFEYNEQMKRAGKILYWLQECFPEMCKSERFQEAFKGLTKEEAIPKHFAEDVSYPFKVNALLTENHKTLCVGTGTTGENSRAHDTETSYTINLDDMGKPHVSDNIALLTSRHYLDDASNVPHTFNEIFIEVSCGATLFLYPEFMKFMHSHLNPGGKLYVELSHNLLNSSIEGIENQDSDAWSIFLPMVNMKWPWEEQKVTFPSEIENTTYNYDAEGDETNVIVKFNGDWKKFFSSFGFENIHLSKVKPVQFGSLPIEMTKKL